MSSSPKSSLIERLVQDRLRSGALDASAAHLLRLGDTAPGDATIPAATEGPAGPTNGEAGMTALVRPPLLMTPRGTAALDTTPLGATSLGSASLEMSPNGMLPPAAPPLVTRSLASEFLADPAQGTPAARPRLDPTPPPVAPPPFPPTAAAPPVAVQTSMAPPLEPAPLAAPPTVSQTGTSRDAERSDLVQGPPTIDAVALERGGMVDWSRTRSRISEEFRLVQRQILRAAFGPGAEPGFSNLLMVTSARPGEGKSFTSVNLAGSIARQGDHHVLLVDADSKRDSFCYALGLAEMRGLLDLVANPKLDPSPLIVKTPIDRLSILPVGRERERSAELFSTKEMTRLIQSLGRRYADRLLVLDAPPCLSTSDPAVLAPVVGQILFVVEADRTQRDEVEASLDLIQACPNITLVLNKQQISSRYTFGAYSSYYSS
jgi:receptor protein-tyrosine kinase